MQTSATMLTPAYCFVDTGCGIQPLNAYNEPRATIATVLQLKNPTVG